MDLVQGTSYAGKLLLAMPQNGDQRFIRTVVYVCVHNPDGAMGIVINKHVNFITFPQLLNELHLPNEEKAAGQIPIHYGGPVEANRGFVLHTADYAHDSTLKVTPEIGLSATLETLDIIARGEGPHKCIVALGYAGWGPGQLDKEVKDNGWIPITSDENLLFDTDVDDIWQNGFKRLGVDVNMISEDTGHA